MERRTSPIARIFASLALIAAVVAVIVVVSGSQGEDSSSTSNQGQAQRNDTSQQRNQQTSQQEPKAKRYKVKSGDTLTSISEKTGVSVPELRTLNPEVDPQILQEGETLKLR